MILAACGGARDPGPPLQVTGETTKLRDEDPLPRTSPFFDGARVTLRAARGEILGLAVWRRGAGSVPVSLTVDGASVSAFAVESLPVVRPSTAMYGGSAGGGHWPDPLRAVPGAVDTARVAFFDVRADLPGDHAGTLTVGDATYPVSLHVDAITLPPLDQPYRVWAYTDQPVTATLAPDGIAACDENAPSGPCMALPFHPVTIDQEARWAGTTPTPFAIPIDEPHTEADRARVKALADQVHAAAGGKPFLYAVTDQPHDDYGDAIDVYISPFAVTLAHPGAWTYNGTPPFAGSMVLDADGASLRTWGWIGWRWQVPLWYVWQAAYWNDKYHHVATDLSKDAVTFDDGEDHGNLDGVLAYPDGRTSWRAKVIRRGLEDRALLDLLAACRGRDAADAIAAPLVPRALGDAHRGDDAAWPHDEATWEAARERLLDALAACR